MCSQFKHQFKWIKTDSTNFKYVDNLVKGGSKGRQALSIGRFHDHDRFIVGSVDNDTLMFSIDPNKNETRVSRTFDVLVYEDICQYYVDRCVEKLTNVERDCSLCIEIDPY